MDGLSDVQRLLAEPQAVVIGDKVVFVRAFQLRNIGRVMSLATPVIDSLTSKPDGASELALFELLDLHHDQITELVALSCGEPVEWIRGLEPADAVELYAAMIAKNSDFFSRALPRILSTLTALTLGPSASKSTSPNPSVVAAPTESAVTVSPEPGPG